MSAKILTFIILILVTAGVYLNQIEKMAIDRSKIPMKVEESKGFQRWITNLKNTDFVIEADEFELVEENEIYNTKWVQVNSIDEEGKEDEYNSIIEAAKDQDMVVFSISGRQFVDYRPIDRAGYKPNEVHFYGLRDDKVINLRAVDCSTDANCYFDRAWFLEDSNDVVVISEISRNIDKKETTPPVCSIDMLCTYTFKLHVIDLLRNSRLIYESKPVEVVLEKVIPEL